MDKSGVTISELQEQELPFLFELWSNSEVMKYTDELPSLRGWSKSDDAETAWARHLERRASLGRGYVQMVLRLVDGSLIGESFFAPLPEGFTLDEWKKPRDLECLMGDIKLMVEYWGRGLGTEGMRKVVEWLFENTDCALLVVPPHASNPAAVRVYEKAGFIHTGESSAWQGHRMMELWRRGSETVRG